MSFPPGGPVGLIAGGGTFPILVAEAVRDQGLPIVAVAHLGETDPALSEKVDQIVWIQLGQFGHLIRVLKEHGVTQALMAGTITKGRIFERVRPDLKGLALISRLAVFHDDNILRAISKELAREGIEIVSSTCYLPQIVAPEGCLTKRKPNRVEKDDIQFGWKIARELGRLDIGQCVVVRKRTVLALEAIEGTDETILRGGRLGKENAVVVKISKPHQDLRFDVPSVGLETIRVLSRVKGSVLAVEAGRTLLFDKEEMVQEANREGISVICLQEP